MRNAIRSRRSVLPSIYVAAAATQPVVKSRLGIESSVRAGTIILPGSQEARSLRAGFAALVCLPNPRHKSLRSCRIGCVFIAKRLAHHLLFRTNTKREQDCERDHIRRTCDPIRDDKRLPHRIQHQRRVHWMADPAIHALRDQSMLRTHLQCDRPVRTKISVRLVEQPKAHHEADHARDERAKAKRVLGEREQR